MFDLRKSVILLTIIVLVLTISVMSCKKTGSLLPNQKPVVEITSYEGKMIDDDFVDDPSIIDTLVDKNDIKRSLFQQKIFWNAYDVDGEVTGYAYRVKDKYNNPLQLAGAEAISEDGWVYHYKDGADESIPLMNEDGIINNNVATIWTDQLSATVNFSAADENADSINTPNIFELKCRDNRGLESDIERRAFLAYSEIPEVLITTSKGNVQGRNTGTGLRFKFSIDDEDPFIPATPYFYKYRVFKVDMDTEEPLDTSAVDYKTWYSTQYYPNISEVNITGIEEEGKPVLTTDFSDDDQTVQATSTCIEVVAYDLAGIESESKKVTFKVHNNYSPDTVIYNETTRALGDYHYTVFPPKDNLIVPTSEGNSGTIYSLPLYKDNNDINSVVWSNNLKFFFAWGYHGEYQDDKSTEEKLDKVLDANSDFDDLSYYAEIIYYDIRMETEEGEKLDMIPELRENVITDTNGTRWIRIPQAHSSSQKFTLTNVSPDSRDADSYSTLFIRAVDNQYKVDPTPVEYKFKTIEVLPYEQRKNVLLVLDKVPGTADLTIDECVSRYSNMLSNYIDSDQIDYYETLSGAYGIEPRESEQPIMSPTDLCDYKVLIMADEDLLANSFMGTEYNAMKTLDRIGTNIVFISGAGHAEAFDIAETNEGEIRNLPFSDRPPIDEYSFYTRNFGIFHAVHIEPFYDPGEGLTATNKQFFTGATAVTGTGFGDVNVSLGTELGDYGFRLNYVNGGQRIGGISTILDNPEFDGGYEPVMIHNLVDSTTVDSDEEMEFYRQLVGRPAMTRYKLAPTTLIPRVRTNYLIMFPPSFMDQVQMKAVMESMMDDILQN